MLLTGTFIHLLESFSSIFLVYNYKYYLYQWKDFRLLSLANAYIFIFIWVAAVFLEMYLVFGSDSITGFIISLFNGYFIIVSLTLIPEALVIIVYEASLNLMTRDPQMSRPGFYISFFELFCELAGLYGEDMRLTRFFADQIDQIVLVFTANSNNEFIIN